MDSSYLTDDSMKHNDMKITENINGDIFAILNLPGNVKKSILSRKEQEKKNRWISVRGDSILFYLDFKDLGALILNNWDLFKDDFPGQSWVSTKIEELGNCRNLVAHNSFIGSHERDVIRVNFNSIINQLSTAFFNK